MRWKGQKVVFTYILMGMMIPMHAALYPLTEILLTLTKTHWALIIPYVAFNIPITILILSGFITNIPYEMEEAARVDGCGPIRTYARIMLPMAQAPMLVCGVLSLVWHWNDYFEPGIYINTKPDLRMLPSILPSLYSLLNQENHTMIQVNDLEGIVFNEAMLMAATFLCIIPSMIAYLILQRRFMEGVERSGLTGM